MNCSSQVKDITKECFNCGYYANSSSDYCYNCGTYNINGYLICSNCKKRLEAKQNSFLFSLLCLIGFLPIYVFYAGKIKAGIVRMVLLLLSIIFLGIGISGRVSGSSTDILSMIGISGFVVIFIGWFLDNLKFLFHVPRPYTNSEGLVI